MGDDDLDPNAIATDTSDDLFSNTTRAEESSLSSWAGPYVTEMLGRGQALAGMPYTAYQGPLTAGESGLQTQAYQGLGALTAPITQMGGYTPTSFTEAGVAQQYMSPYLQMSLEPQIAEAQRQAEIARTKQASRLSKAGAYGGGRQAIMDSELIRNTLRNIADITGTGYQQAFTEAQGQFNTEEQARRQAQEMMNQFGFDVFEAQRRAGAEQRGIEGEGIAADIAQFKEERDFPYKQVQYMQSLLQGMPVGVASYEYTEPSGLSSLLAGAQGGSDIYTMLSNILNPATANPATANSVPAASTLPTGMTAETLNAMGDLYDVGYITKEDFLEYLRTGQLPKG